MRKKHRDKLAQLVLTEVYNYIAAGAVNGQSLKVLDVGVAKILAKHGVESSTVGYMGFGSNVSWGVNHRLAHMPSSNLSLSKGDLVSADVAIKVADYHYDSCRSFLIPGKGQDMEKKSRLIQVAKEARDLAISLSTAGTRLRTIRTAVNKFVTNKGFYVSPSMGGHGVYDELHHEPLILYGNMEGQYDRYILEPGARVTMEPIISERPQLPSVDKFDGWTLYLDKNNLSAYWEETIEIQEEGPPKIVTQTFDKFTLERTNNE